VEYEVLGHLRVLDKDGAAVQLSAPKLRTLLALLLVNRGRPVSVDRIADALWGRTPPGSAANLVQGYVRDLRRRLGAHEITTVPGGYRLDVMWGSVDAERFEDLVRARRYEQALALWHGAALEEWAEDPWARATAVRLEEMRLSTMEARLAQEVDAGRASAVLAELAALVEEHPLRERIRILLVKALYAAGRQADALAAYAQARRYLADEVGLEPGPELRAVEAAVLAQDASLSAAPARSSAAPPAPVTPLVGRDSDLAALRSALATARLVTLSGPGGIGKTRLAVEIAATPVLPTGGPAWFVDLTPVLAGSDVATSVARALQLAESPEHEIDLICDYLSRRPALLVLDTCEHVVEAVAELATRLLSRCPDLRILATTRQPLRAPGEQIIQLSGLGETASAEVFTARARAANPSAELAADRIRAVVGKLEGVPLALELAAARTASLSLEQLVDSLERPLDALADGALAGDPRHRTMRAVIRWSHDLLDGRDRRAFAALSVFVGSFDREAAGAVVDNAPDAVDHLLGRSLLTRDADLIGRARYRFLDPVRQFAQETATPTLRDSAGRQHLGYHVSLAARINAQIRTVEATKWAAIARACADDLRKAATYAISERSVFAGRLIADLYWPWFLDGQLSELRSWANAVLSAESDAHVRVRLLRILASTALAQGDAAIAVDYAGRHLDAATALPDLELMALAQNLLGMAAWARGNYSAAIEYHVAAMSSARSCGRPWTLALVTALAGRSAHAIGDRETGERLLREAEALAEKVGEPMVLGSALDYRAHAEFASGRATEAAALASRSLAAYRSIGYQEGLASAGTLAAQLAVLTGDHERADTLLHEALDVTRRLRHLGGTASVLEAMAVLDHDRGDYQRAGLHLDDARALRQQTGTVPSPALHDQLSRVERSLVIER
jgi:predicted ATPase/DNA-binding SARP family transcriptional activator